MFWNLATMDGHPIHTSIEDVFKSVLEDAKVATARARLNESELAVCHVSGITPVQYLESRAALAKRDD